MTRFALALVLVMGIGCTAGGGAGAANYNASDKTKRLIVLGIDGMDPVLLRQYMEEGRTPNLKKIAESYQPGAPGAGVGEVAVPAERRGCVLLGVVSRKPMQVRGCQMVCVRGVGFLRKEDTDDHDRQGSSSAAAA